MNDAVNQFFNIDEVTDPEVCREIGKKLWSDPAATAQTRGDALRFLEKAIRLKDPEAMFLFGRLLVEERIRLKEGDSLERGRRLILTAAERGYPNARTYLNRHCREKSLEETDTRRTEADLPAGPLRDSDGKEIKIDRTGVLTPIDAVLRYENGENILTLSANVVFLSDGEGIADPKAFYGAVSDGMRAWQGEYAVFGNQKVRVQVNLTFEDRLFDNLWVLPVTGDVAGEIKRLSARFGSEKTKSRMENLVDNKRSFAGVGLKKWSVRSRKFIYIQSQSGRFDDLDEIRDVAKHEFGHALGLGDLYSSPSDGLEGVSKGSFRELDSYYVSDRVYNLVMCDHHGPISDNDIEMVILAFSENAVQNYQPSALGKKISKALGTGN